MNGSTKTAWVLGGLGIAGLVAYLAFRNGGGSDRGGASGDGEAGDSGASDLGASPWSLEGIGATLTQWSQQVGSLVGITPRGIRNNNPGNLMYSASVAWNGQTGEDSGGYAVFDTPEHGVRAMGHQLMDYAGRGMNTVSAIISTWAPAIAGNPTGAYIANVAAALGVDPAASIDVYGNLPALAAAIIQQENGEQPYAAADLETWVYET